MSALPDWTEGAARLVLQECAGCGRRWYLRRARCPGCGAADPVRRACAGTGTVAAATAVAGDGPVHLVLVDLDEGVRVLGRADPGLGPADRVRVTFRGTPALPHFTAPDPTPAEGS